MSVSDNTRQPALLASLLVRHMANRGLSQAELSKRSGVHKTTVHRWTTGSTKGAYDPANVLRLAAALNLQKIDTNRLLRAAGRPSIDALAVSAGDELRELLQCWQAPVRNNLPAPLTSFVGRADEIEQLSELLCHDTVRLVTLTGAGGSGKTRLALRVAEEVLDVFPDGLFFVSLAPLTDPALIIPTIAETIGLRDAQDTPLTTRLHDWLRSRQLLLILDNLEHLPDAGGEIVDLLRAARRLTVLATSREPLRLTGEHEWPVLPLPLPETGQVRERHALRQLRENPAIDLFVQRGRAAARYVPDDDDLPAIAEICARLDGLPLAIELAAARLRERRPDQLLAEFPSQLDLASDGPRDAPHRQQTLRATIAWSVDLLPERARALLLQLSVFTGGWNEEAACAVCAATDDDLDLLRRSNLIEQSELPGGTIRFNMLETIHEYGRERLAACGTEHDRQVHERHARYFLALAESAPPYVPEARTTDWYDRINADLDNLRAALDWAESRDDRQLLARLTVALWPYWHEYHQVHEGRRRLETILAFATELEPRLHAVALTGAATLAATQTAFDVALTYAQTALTLSRQVGDHRGQALNAQQLGWMHFLSGRSEQAIEFITEELEQWRATRDPLGIALGLSDLAAGLYISGDFDAAVPYLEEAERIQRAVGDETGLARSLCDRGLHALLQYNVTAAIPLLSAAVDRLRHAGGVFLLLRTRFYLATAYCVNEQLDEAHEIYLDLLRTHEEIDDRAELALTLLGFAALAHRQGNGRRAAKLCGTAQSIQQAAAVTLPPAVAALYNHEVSLVLRHIDPESFQAAFAEGQQLSVEEAIALARAG